MQYFLSSHILGERQDLKRHTYTRRCYLHDTSIPSTHPARGAWMKLDTTPGQATAYALPAQHLCRYCRDLICLCSGSVPPIHIHRHPRPSQLSVKPTPIPRGRPWNKSHPTAAFCQRFAQNPWRRRGSWRVHPIHIYMYVHLLGVQHPNRCETCTV